MASKSKDPLATRHVFLDTEVFRRLGYNPKNPALQALARHVKERRVVLHTTDVTLAEAERHINEDVAAKFREIAKTERSLIRWRHHDKDLPAMPAFDARKTATKVFRAFSNEICSVLGARVHKAASISGEEVFRIYFARNAPFDRESSKEFPDAFMILALRNWCEQNSASMYVVTKDKAMLRAAEETDCLFGLETIGEVLEGASAQPKYDQESLAEQIMATPEIDSVIEDVHAQLADDLIFIYYGDLPEGEVIEQEVGDIELITDYSVAWLGDKTVCLIFTIQTDVHLKVEYEDRSLAMYDREDDTWFGADIEHTDIHQVIPMEVFVELELRSRTLISAELLRTDYFISDSETDL